MKKVLFFFAILLSLILGSGLYLRYEQNQKKSYWLNQANKAVTNSDQVFIEFYNKFLYHLQTRNISDGWDLFERYKNNNHFYF